MLAEEGSPHQGESASFIWALHACQPAWAPFFLWKFPPGMEEDFERSSVTLIMFRTGYNLPLGLCRMKPGGGRLQLGNPSGWGPPPAGDPTQGCFVRLGTCAGAAVL